MVVGLTPSCFCYVSKIREDNERGKGKEKCKMGKRGRVRGKEKRKGKHKTKGKVRRNSASKGT